MKKAKVSVEPAGPSSAVELEETTALTEPDLESGLDVLVLGSDGTATPPGSPAPPKTKTHGGAGSGDGAGPPKRIFGHASRYSNGNTHPTEPWSSSPVLEPFGRSRTAATSLSSQQLPHTHHHTAPPLLTSVQITTPNIRPTPATATNCNRHCIAPL